MPTIEPKPLDWADRRRAAESIDESLVVEAGAGTGKTTLLVTRIVNLLRKARVDDPPRPVRMSEIVAITFTEKAAGELKARLRDALERAAASGRYDGEPLDADERAALADALADLDRASVSTIHSFCAGLMRERPVEAGIDPGRGTIDQLAQSLLCDEAWQRWRDEAFQDADDEVLGDAIRLGIRPDRASSDDRSANLRDLAYSLIRNRDLLEHLPEPIDDVAAWAECRRQVGAQVEAMRGCLTHAKKECKAGRIAREFIEEWTALSAITSPRDARAKLLEVAIEDKLGGDAKKWRDKTKLDELRRLLDETREQLLPQCQATMTHNLTVAVGRRLAEFVRSYEQLKEDRGVLDFDDLLLGARRLLAEHEEARLYFRDRFRFLLIDEFQDTDPLQAEVAMLLGGASGEDSGQRSAARGQQQARADRLFVVGDPKQSIYRFRRADIEVYDECVRELGESQHLRIQQNFRSGHGLIGWVNRVFQRLIARSAYGYYQPDYVPLLPGPKAAESAGEVVLLYPPQPTDRQGHMDKIRFREGCAIARLIQRAVTDEWPIGRGDRPLHFGDVAVLMPQTTGIEYFEEALRACELPYQIHRGRHLYKRLEIKSLINVVAAIDNPEDAIAVVGVLRSAFFGCSDEDLLRHSLAGGRFNYLRPSAAAPEPIAGAFELLARLHRDRNSRPVHQLLIDFFDATKGLESFLTKPHGEARVANLMKVVDAARSLERGGAVTFRGFAGWLEQRQTDREGESEGATAEPGDESVQVMTVHAAKGLEFPMTVVANLAAGERAGDGPLVFDRSRGVLHMCCGNLATRDWHAAAAWDQRRDEAERIRLFYVAATRARDYLVLPVYWNKAEKQPGGMLQYIKDLVPPPASPPWRAHVDGMRVFDTRELGDWPEVTHSPRVDLEELAGAREAEAFLTARTEWLRERDGVLVRASAGRRIIRPSAESEEPAAPQPTAAADGPRGAQFGRLAHRLLELRLSGAAGAGQEHQFATRLAADDHLDNATAASAAALVAAAIETPLVQRLIAAKRLHLEVPFTYAQDGALVEGRLDALAEEDAGLLLVDFKTDSIAPGDEPARAEHYASQLRAYAAAVSAATGQTVREAHVLFLRTLVGLPIALNAENLLAAAVAQPQTH
jgi:ATP-dependent exoDNAse (exonuclease V) beta subunit